MLTGVIDLNNQGEIGLLLHSALRKGMSGMQEIS